ncbi:MULTISPECIES: HAD hydrolase family protein [unclassified Granulicatella]|uniref:HAD hydrolase family protein n=1 Tax=unclassified Granulicatella TaxID=2630493 RepID=UPI0010743CB5|nr:MULTISPECIES: HAD hydrolase family protein [unclassified Granulicatella]MBF0780794.1 HAD hydrolase family protein [Granulicatella sp. 19428wC4_WM01]TFU93839.1 hypothetical protein E4T68_06750 [Granulicatella sp. WM01]
MKYLITDLDGTLFFKNDTGDVLLEKLKKISCKYRIILATGRSYDDFLDVFDFNKLGGYIYGYVFSNGSQLIRGSLKKYNYFDKAKLKKFIDIFVDKNIFLLEYENQGLYEAHLLKDSNYNNIIRLRVNSNSIEIINTCITLASSFDFRIIFFRENTVDIYPPKVSKLETALSLIDDKSSIIYAVGDGINDLSFLSFDKVEGYIINNKFILSISSIWEII